MQCLTPAVAAGGRGIQRATACSDAVFSAKKKQMLSNSTPWREVVYHVVVAPPCVRNNILHVSLTNFLLFACVTFSFSCGNVVHRLCSC